MGEFLIEARRGFGSCEEGEEGFEPDLMHNHNITNNIAQHVYIMTCVGKGLHHMCMKLACSRS